MKNMLLTKQSNIVKTICILLFFACSSKLVAQLIPTISPSAYRIKIESYTASNLSTTPIIPLASCLEEYKIRRNFELSDNDQAYYYNTISSSWQTVIPNYFSFQIFVDDIKRPNKFYYTHIVDSVIRNIPPTNVGFYNDPNNEDPCSLIYPGQTILNIGYTTLMGNINLQYPNFDTTIKSINYGDSIRIRVDFSTDNNFNLPSHDTISIRSTANNLSGYEWQFNILDLGGFQTNWVTVPSNLTTVNSSSTSGEIQVCGSSLLPNTWESHLNKTILFRLAKVVGAATHTSNVLIYTHRLSSPHITEITPFVNKCFGQDSAYLDISFDRILRPDEKLNILLKDSITSIDYSALNLVSSNFSQSTNFPYNSIYRWRKELIGGTYRIALIGKYQNIATYTGSPEHIANTKVPDPAKLNFVATQEPVLCFGGNSGKINILAKGGNGNYKYDLVANDSSFTNIWQPFVNPTYQVDGFYDYAVTGKSAKTYKIKVRDGNNCKLLDSIGSEIFRVRTVYQPPTPLSMPLLVTSPITAHNVADGSIAIRLAGGSPYILTPENAPTFKKYQFEWRDSATNVLINNYTLDTVGKFETKIQNLPEGTYRFTAWDRNYNIMPGTNQQGCRIDFYIRLKKPEPLSITIVAINPVNCNGEANGKLKAIASGGIPVSDSLRYNFTWYKQVNGNYVNQNVNDSILPNAGAGNYYVEIKDKNNYLKTSVIFNFIQPLQLLATPTTTPSSCYFTANGTMSVTPNGGTAPYKYEWSNGALTQNVTNVGGGTYYVVVKDSKLCQTTQQVVVTSPNRIIATPTITPISCNSSNTAAISLSATGGTGVYTYLWSTGATTSSINNIGIGNYWYKVFDANGCFDSSLVSINNPENYIIEAGINRKLCLNQVIRLTPTISTTNDPLTTKWITPQGTKDSVSINVSSPGIYILKVSNNSGCVKLDTIIVTPENATVNTSFTVSTQAFVGENATLVNISPQLQDSVKWLLPQGVSYQFISSSKNFCEIKFADTGVFTVGIKAYYANGCIDEKYKNINVITRQGFINIGSQADAFLKKFDIDPNPTTGFFTLNLLFNNVTPAKVRIINILTNVNLNTKQLIGAASYTEQYNISSYPAGTYIIVIETAKGNFIHKLNKI